MAVPGSQDHDHVSASPTAGNLGARARHELVSFPIYYHHSSVLELCLVSHKSQISNLTDIILKNYPSKPHILTANIIMLCGLINTIWYETYDLWDAFLLGLGGLLVKLGL